MITSSLLVLSNVILLATAATAFEPCHADGYSIGVTVEMDPEEVQPALRVHLVDLASEVLLETSPLIPVAVGDSGTNVSFRLGPYASIRMTSDPNERALCYRVYLYESERHRLRHARSAGQPVAVNFGRVNLDSSASVLSSSVCSPMGGP